MAPGTIDTARTYCGTGCSCCCSTDGPAVTVQTLYTTRTVRVLENTDDYVDKLLAQIRKLRGENMRLRTR